MALVEVGIGEPTRSRLADLPHITPAVVRKAAGKVSENGKGTGLIVREIESQCEAAGVRADRERKKAHREQERRQAEEAERRKLDDDRQRTDAILAGATPEELKAAREAAIAEALPVARNLWVHQEPGSETRAFKYAIADQLSRSQECGSDG